MIDSDSDTDLLANNPFTSTSISVKGPNTKNISLSFRNNALTSTMNMSRNIEWPRSTQSIYEQRSVNNRREMSPMSIRSAHVFQGRNMNSSHRARGLSLQRPVFNGRGGSPVSIRSSASNVSAVDIATAIKNNQFSKTDLKIIQSACNKFMKHQTRKRIEKRRKLNVFLKGARRRSSSERELSDSSISNDDCKSTRTSIYKDNMSSCRSTRTDISKIRRTLQDTNMYKDCSANFKQNSFRNKFSIASSNTNSNNYGQSQPLHSTIQLKDRFRSGILLPSERFNKSVASTVIHENIGNTQNNEVEKHYTNTKTNGVANNVSFSSDSENEEIFSETVKENSLKPQQKQSLHYEHDITVPDKKRKNISPIKKLPLPNGHVQRNNRASNSSDDADDLIFIKPAVPVRKITKKGPEKLLATSSQPFIKPVEIKQNICKNQQPDINVEQATKDNHGSENHPTTEVSMRPSFIKRKLFSQKLDIGENKSAGIDDPLNSPQTVYSAIQKEKNKARKLVTTQSCLSRDVQEGSNMLDLIHKIVPPDRINVTVQTNKSKPDVHASKNKHDTEDKWDVTSIISTCNNDNMSDTYTDEETFEEANNDNTKHPNTSSSKSKFAPEYKILVEKMNISSKNIKEQISSKTTEETHRDNAVKMVNTKLPCHTEFESDFESNEPVRNNNSIIRIYKKDTLVANKDTSHLTVLNHIKRRNVTLETKAALDNTTASHKFNTTNFRIRSHRAPKRKKCCQPEEANNTKCEPQNNKKSRQDDDCQSDVFPDYSDGVIEAKNNKNCNTKRKCQTPKQIKQKLDLKPVKNKLNTSIELKKDNKSNNIDSSSIFKENDSKNKANGNNKTNSKSTCRTPKQSKQKTVTQPVKSNNVKTNSSIKSKHIDLPNLVTTKNEENSKLKINDNSSDKKQSSQASRRNKKQTNCKSDQAKLDHSLETSKNLRSRQIDLSISSNKENDASGIPNNGKGKKRSCRTPKQKDSCERNDNNSKLDLSVSNFDDSCRSLRSRKIDLTSSLINEKLHKSRAVIKNQSKVFNKNAEVNSRKSDISFSLVPNKKPLAKYKRG